MSRRRTSSSGILFVVSAPSGAGKTTLVHNLLRWDRSLSKTVSHTTRLRRSDEEDGRDYHFVSRTRFEKMIREKSFVEWVGTYGDLYGTSRRAIEKARGRGKDAVLVIESHGGRAIHRLYPDAVRILVLPPDMATLRRRLQGRGERNQLRLQSAVREARSMADYDYVVVNDRLPSAQATLEAIVLAERQRMGRQQKVLRKFLP